MSDVHLILDLGNLFWFLEAFRIFSSSWDLMKSSINLLTCILPKLCLSEDACISLAKMNFLLLFPSMISFPFIIFVFPLWNSTGWRNLASWISLKSLSFPCIYHLFLCDLHSKKLHRNLPFHQEIMSPLIWLFRLSTKIFIFIILF